MIKGKELQADVIETFNQITAENLFPQIWKTHGYPSTGGI
jgi:hypothetical protein